MSSPWLPAAEPCGRREPSRALLLPPPPPSKMFPALHQRRRGSGALLSLAAGCDTNERATNDTRPFWGLPGFAFVGLIASSSSSNRATRRKRESSGRQERERPARSRERRTKAPGKARGRGGVPSCCPERGPPPDNLWRPGKKLGRSGGTGADERVGRSEGSARRGWRACLPRFLAPSRWLPCLSTSPKPRSAASRLGPPEPPPPLLGRRRSGGRPRPASERATCAALLGFPRSHSPRRLLVQPRKDPTAAP